jgi:hypothetical protein
LPVLRKGVGRRDREPGFVQDLRHLRPASLLQVAPARPEAVRCACASTGIDANSSAP